MLTSRLTSRGQTTIPVAVREALGLRPQDRLVYEIRDDQVIVRALKGNLLDHKRSVRVPTRTEEHFAVREEVKRKIAKRAAKR